MRKTIDRPFEVKEVSEEGVIKGYASVFGEVDWYRDVVERGAFRATLADAKAKGKTIPILYQHEARNPIGKWTHLEEDDRGLYVEGQLLLDLGLAKSTHTLIKAGIMRGLSIGFDVPPGGSEWDAKTATTRLRAVDLWEASVVTFPACEPAQVISVKEARESERDLEKFLRESGWSRRDAKAIVAGGWTALVSARDADGEEGREGGSSGSRDAKSADLVAALETLSRRIKG